MSLIKINLGAKAYDLTPEEAGIVRDWLRKKRTMAAQSLATAIGVELAATEPHRIRLGMDDIDALRAVLRDVNVSGLPGLKSLQNVLSPDGRE